MTAPFELPDIIPVFPLTGVLLLPRGKLPLNIFEPRYLAMVTDALATPHRLIGMIQPTDPESTEATPDLFRIGCAGRITSFSETEDGRNLITLSGLTRFAVVEEVESVLGYRRVRARWDEFTTDFDEEEVRGFDRERLLEALKQFLKLHAIAADWDSIQQTPDERLVTSLAMICPFTPPEKQALLESANLGDRAATMTALIEMALVDQGGGETAALH